MPKNPRAIAALAATFLALAALPALSTALAAETGARPTESVAAKETSPRDNEATKKSALEKLSLKKLTLEKSAPEKETAEKSVTEKPTTEEPPPQKPESAPEVGSDRNPNKGSKRATRAVVASEPAPPPPARKAIKAEERLPKPAPPAAKPSISGNQLMLSIPRLGIENLVVGDSPAQSYLDREGIMHLSGTGFPYKHGSNTYIAGHAEGYSASRVPRVFRDLEDLQQGDHVILQDAAGETYDYRIYERFVVTPYDTWVTKPVFGKQVVSLQTCSPAPTFDKRLIVRGELMK